MKMSAKQQAYLEFAASRLAGLAVDAVMLLCAYVVSFLLRFDLHAPRWGWRTTVYSFVSVLVVHLVALVICGVYRLAWRRTDLRNLPRYFLATFVSCVALTVLRFALPIESYAHVRPPYSVTLICFVLASLALVGWRIVWSWLWTEHAKRVTLLERPVMKMDETRVRSFFEGKTVMVTGAGGSIGSELVRQVARLSPKELLLVERSENALYEIDRELRDTNAGVKAVPLMKDINDVAAMENVFSEHRPEIVIHAAAYKHVPMVEMNPEEGWRNNTEGTEKVATLALKYGVRRFVLISTDKAVNPVSVMGKTKREAEARIMSLNTTSSTLFCAVRFGNVLGSSGSVVPLFREQIAKGRAVTVTDPEMRRYFMTVSEAVSLVLQAASRSEKAIYTLDMGESVRIVDLASEMIRQAGYRPYVDIPIVFTGVRPGEKLFEELDVSETSRYYKTDMAKIYITN